jgi:glycosyltransferase involved in cell wall biosynthesis
MNLGVLHCIPSIEPAYGGPVVVARGLCRELSTRGARVSVLAASSGSAEKDRKNASAFGRADFIWTKPLVRRFYWEPFLEKKTEALFGRSDIVHVHGVFNGLSSSACASARRAGIPYVLTPFGTLSPYCLKKNAFLKRAALLAGERANIEGAAAVHFSSASEASRVRAAFKIKESIEAPNGIEWSDFERLPARGAFRKSRKWDDSEIVWLFVGRLQPIKGLEPFLKAFIPWCRNRREKNRLAIVGPDEANHRMRLEKIVRELEGGRIVGFEGPIYGASRVQAMVDSDVFVLPSHHENFGIAAAEAMACRRPVWVSEHADISEAVKQKNAGEVSGLGAIEIKESLERMLSRRAQWDEMGSRGYDWVNENCRWEKIGRKMAEAYERLARKKACLPCGGCEDVQR